MMKITGLYHLFKWENLHNWWLTKYFFAPLYVYMYACVYGYIYPKNIWGIGNDADNYIDGTNILSAILS